MDMILHLSLIYVSAQYLPHFTNINIFLHLHSISRLIHLEKDSSLQLHPATRYLEVLKLEQMRFNLISLCLNSKVRVLYNQPHGAVGII